MSKSLFTLLPIAALVCLSTLTAPSAQAVSPEVKDYIEQDIAKHMPEINSLRDEYYTALNCLSVAYLKAGNYTKAVETLHEVLVGFPQSITVASNLGFAYLLNQQLDQAEAEAKRILTLPKQSSSHDDRPQVANLLLGMVAEQRGQLANAQTFYKQSCQAKNEEICSYLSKHADGKGYFAQFIAEYNASLEAQLEHAIANKLSLFETMK